MAPLNQDDVKVLEQLRQRLLQLTASLSSLRQNIYEGDPLPAWASLQSQASIISNSLSSVAQHLSENQDLLSAMVAYPTSDFPGRTQEGLLGQLLRKKLEPSVDSWVERGARAATDAFAPPADVTGTAMAIDRTGLTEVELAELWDWAPPAANAEARKRNWGGNFTLEEREMGIENVKTGLRRKLEDYDDEDDDDEEEDSDGEAGDAMDTSVGTATLGAAGTDGTKSKEEIPPLPLDNVFRFMVTGVSRPR